jgi:hypothetical protein
MRKNMDEVRISDKEALNKYMKSVPYGEYSDVRRKIIEGCKIPTYTFSNWMSGIARIPELHKDKIEEIIRVSIFKHPSKAV